MILNKGIIISNLLNSDVFKLYFKNENWPDTHHCKDTAFMPFNGQLFSLADHYEDIFTEKRF